jgi:5-oxoprolinase (ATP-hydrolysing)
MITAASLELFEPAFLQHYEREFGFLLEGRALLVDDVRVRAVGKSDPAPTIQV